MVYLTDDSYVRKIKGGQFRATFNSIVRRNQYILIAIDENGANPVWGGANVHEPLIGTPYDYGDYYSYAKIKCPPLTQLRL